MMRENTKKKTRSIEMVTGSLWKNILFFSIPLMCSQLLEVMFNLSDVAVVGHFADYKALGAVGSTTLLVTLFTGFLIGMGSGVNVRVAHALGAKNHENTVETIQTSLFLCTLIGLLIGAVCFFLSGGMLRLLNTKDDLIDQASLYLRIYALCMPAMGIYNFGNGVLSARGETKRPLYYLAIAGVLNVLLNLFFVIVFHMAAAGVATATAIAQYVSAALIMIHLVRRKDECHVSLKNIRFHRDAGVQVLMIGIPAGIQSAVFAIANLFVQAGVNSFNTITVSGNAAATNADSLIFNVLYAFYTGCSSFMSQNYGARNKKRVLKSYFVCLFYSFFASVLLGVLLFVFGHQFLSLFATDTRQSSMPACRGYGSWLFPMLYPYLWTAQLQHHVESAKRSFRPLSSSSVPVHSVSFGSIRSLPGFIRFRHFICYMFFRGSSLQPQKSFILP